MYCYLWKNPQGCRKEVTNSTTTDTLHALFLNETLFVVGGGNNGTTGLSPKMNSPPYIPGTSLTGVCYYLQVNSEMRRQFKIKDILGYQDDEEQDKSLVEDSHLSAHLIGKEGGYMMGCFRGPM